MDGAPSTELPPTSSYQQGGRDLATYEHFVRSESERGRPTNEYVLNVAFFSFFGFMLLQAGFAILVDSQSMLADSEAMGVDAITYLFNSCAERIKNAPYSAQELKLPADVREYKRTLKRLYLELIPPLISVSTLIGVTVLTLCDATHTLFGGDNKNSEVDTDADDEMVGVMLFFSALNLVLDIVNVTCFAKADQAYVHVLQSQDELTEFKKSLRGRTPSEDLTLLLPNTKPPIAGNGSHGNGSSTYESNGVMVDEDIVDDKSLALVNLNMCSAWTHVCADTMRSIAVLVAAGIAYLFQAVSPVEADATAAIVVSIIIIVSLLPLLQGLYLTATEIWILTRRPPAGAAAVSLTV